MTPVPLIAIDAEKCVRCWRCARRCPAHAVRIDGDGSVEIIAEKCVRCGLCVTECSHGACRVRSDGERVDELLRGERPVVALMATELGAALYPTSPESVEAALGEAGFFAVETTLLGEEAVALAYEARHGVRNGLPVIRSTCPVVVDWIRKYHPALVGALAPLLPPYVVQAQLIHDTYPDDVAVVYVSPCYARKDEALSEEFAGLIDVAIDFGELRHAITGILERCVEPASEPEHATRRRPEPLKEISLTDGYPRSTLAERDMTASDVRVVRGLNDLEEMLLAIEAGESAPLILDALNCEGCIDGPTVNPGLSLFAKRAIDVAERHERARSMVSSREVLRQMPPLDMRRSFAASPVSEARPDEEELLEVLRDGGIADGVPPLDCGACGFARCVEFAGAIFRGDTTWEACLPRKSQLLQDEVNDLEESATLDALTSLWNRRVFADRLNEEVARHTRYGSPVALLMMDLDGFKEVNDQYGHLCGDQVLVALAEVLRSTLRTTDLPARYGGDEFAVVLPATSKTEAFAVAEKLRLALEDDTVACENGDGELHIQARISIGVAAAGETIREPLQLLEAADRALYQAKASGRNQVRLAPG